MGSLQLNSLGTVLWRPGKSGSLTIAAAFCKSNALPHPSTAKTQSTGNDTALLAVKEPAQELVVWRHGKGCKELQGIKKSIQNVLHICADGYLSGVFFSCHRGEDLGFALLTHTAGSVERVAEAPVVFKAGLAGFAEECIEEKVRSSRKKQKASFFTVIQSVLRRTTAGLVVAATLQTGTGELYGIAGRLEELTWRRCRLPAEVGSTAGVYISADGADVRFVSCSIAAPCGSVPRAAMSNPAAALSSFQAVPTLDGGAAAASSASSSGVVCAALRETVLPTSATATVHERRFESGVFADVVEGRAGFVAVEDKATPVYTIVVPGQLSSYVVHATYGLGGTELVCSAAVIPITAVPLHVCLLSVPQLANRPLGSRLSLLLFADTSLYACEHFGSAVPLTARINGVNSTSLSFPTPAAEKRSRLPWKSSSGNTTAAANTSAGSAALRLLPLRSPDEVLVTNGITGVFLRFSSATLPGAAPQIGQAAVHEPSPMFKNNNDSDSDGVAALRTCLSKLEELSLYTPHQTLPDLVAREVLPLLSSVGTCNEEVMLVQRVYERLLQIAKPRTEADWGRLWTLTISLQQRLARCGAANTLQYTDAFFLQLAEVYRTSSFASTPGVSAVQTALQSAVSTEARGALSARTPQLSAEVSYLMDGLAAAVPPVLLGEELVLRMVRISTSASGGSVVAARPGKAGCVHAMGCVLLAACLDLRVCVCVREGEELRVVMQEPTEVDAACVTVAPSTFTTQAEFEKALTLAADLLCVASLDLSFRPDVALLAVTIGSRSHCLIAYVDLFAQALQCAVAGLAPIADNAAWMADGAAMMPRSVAEAVATLLNAKCCSASSLAGAVVYALYVPQHAVNVAFFKALSNTLHADFCAAAMVTCVLHETEALISAMNNYSTATAALTLQSTEAGHETDAAAVRVSRRRLQVTLARAVALWAEVNALSPYRVRDVAMSYRASVQQSLVKGAMARSSTVVSRTAVMCFRLLCLVSLCEEKVSALEEPKSDAVGDAVVEACIAAIEALYLLSGSPLPLEGLQQRFVDLVQTSAARLPDLAPFSLRLLQISSVSRSSNAAVKRSFYQLLDALQEKVRGAGASVTSARVRQAIAAAEAAVTTLAVQDTHPDFGAAAPNFIFSAPRDASLPKWSASHTLPERRHLVQEDWTDTLWMVERVPSALAAVCERTMTQILACPREAPESLSPSSSPVMAAPLFSHLCRLQPPMQHSATVQEASSPATAAPQRRSPRSLTPLGDADTPEKGIPAPDVPRERFAAADIAWWAAGAPVSAASPMTNSPVPLDSKRATPPAASAGLTRDDDGASSDTATSFTTCTSASGGLQGCGVSLVHYDRGREEHHHNGRSVSPGGRRCRCCRRTIHVHRHGSDRLHLADLPASSVSLRWNEEKTSRSRRRPEKTVTTMMEEDEDMPTQVPKLLTFASRLQVPTEPSRITFGTAPPSRNVSSSPPDGERISLLQLSPSSYATRGASRVRLYSLNGERAAPADAEAAVPQGGVRTGTHSAFLGGGRGPMSHALLPSAAMEEAGNAPMVPPQTPPQVTQAESAAPYASAHLSPSGAPPPSSAASVFSNLGWPPATSVSAYGSGAVQVPGHASSFPPPPPPTAAVPLMTVPRPVMPSSSSPSSVLPPDQLAQFHIYTDDLLARQAALPPPLPSAPTVATLVPLTTSPAPVLGTQVGLEGPAATRLIEQQEDFIRQAELLLRTRDAENNAFHRRVVESVRDLSDAAKGLRGLSPMEQSHLVRDTVKQRNELLRLNHQLLDLQLAAARATGELPPVVADVRPPSPPPLAGAGRSMAFLPGAPPPMTSARRTPTPPTPTERAGVGVSWAAPESTPRAMAKGSATTQTARGADAGMAATLADLQRLNEELVRVNASAEAMDRAIADTRAVIEQYERTKTAEALAAEGVALTAAMRLRTAAVEQRLREVPRRQTNWPHPSRSWASETVAMEAIGDNEPTTTTDAEMSSRPQFTAESQSAAEAERREVRRTPMREAAAPSLLRSPPPPARSTSAFTAVSSVDLTEGAGVDRWRQRARSPTPPLFSSSSSYTPSAMQAAGIRDTSSARSSRPLHSAPVVRFTPATSRPGTAPVRPATARSQAVRIHSPPDARLRVSPPRANPTKSRDIASVFAMTPAGATAIAAHTHTARTATPLAPRRTASTGRPSTKEAPPRTTASPPSVIPKDRFYMYAPAPSARHPPRRSAALPKRLETSLADCNSHATQEFAAPAPAPHTMERNPVTVSQTDRRRESIALQVQHLEKKLFT